MSRLSRTPGKLIVIEGTDGVGRSTHVALLRTWLESIGYAVLDTGMTRSILAGRGIKNARSGHTLGRLTMQLYYATDFADRLENQMLAALRAGFIVLTDRYIYSAIARAVVRGADPEWVRAMYGIALVPDAVFYLRINVSRRAGGPRTDFRARVWIIGNRAWTWGWAMITTTASLPIRNCSSRNSIG